MISLPLKTGGTESKEGRNLKCIKKGEKRSEKDDKTTDWLASGCVSGGGVLAKNSEGMRCLDINHTDLCRDYNGKIIEKPESVFNVEFNNTDYKFNFTG